MNNPAMGITCAMQVIEKTLKAPQEERYYLIINKKQETKIKNSKAWVK